MIRLNIILAGLLICVPATQTRCTNTEAMAEVTLNGMLALACALGTYGIWKASKNIYLRLSYGTQKGPTRKRNNNYDARPLIGAPVVIGSSRAGGFSSGEITGPHDMQLKCMTYIIATLFALTLIDTAIAMYQVHNHNQPAKNKIP